ncbi:hypothetical protein [Phytohabitans rumicis]|uniref:hypothetical protein n=1 Tax=Phytohabitans rumicis TaxID=1076125 RepID=UPI0035309492
MSIRALAGAVGVTHSAASQTVAQMAKAGYVTLEPGTDARQRIVHLTPGPTPYSRSSRPSGPPPPPPCATWTPTSPPPIGCPPSRRPVPLLPQLPRPHAPAPRLAGVAARRARLAPMIREWLGRVAAWRASGSLINAILATPPCMTIRPCAYTSARVQGAFLPACR